MSSYAQVLTFTPLYTQLLKVGQQCVDAFKSSLQVFGFVAAMVVGYVLVTPSARQAIMDLRPSAVQQTVAQAEEADEAEATADAANTATTDAKATAKALAGQQSVAKYLSRKYRVAGSAVQPLVTQAFEVGHEMGVDPLLIVAVMGIESSLNPYAESVVGAQGLMQVMTSVHKDKFAAVGTQTATDPLANIKVGAMILKDCIRRGGSVQAGLGLYVGAGMGNDGGYGAKVLAERSRIEAAMRGKSIDSLIALPQPAKPVQPAVDSTTAVPSAIESSPELAPAVPTQTSAPVAMPHKTALLGS